MSIRPSGLWCDICNSPMLWATTGADKHTGWFTVSISPDEMNCCRSCKPHLNKFNANQFDEMLSELPEGPFKRLCLKYKELYGESTGDNRPNPARNPADT